MFVDRSLIDHFKLAAVHHTSRQNVPINGEQIVENTFAQAFSRALEQTIQNKAEALFKMALEIGSPLSRKMKEKIEQGFQRFVDKGIHWKKKKSGFRK